MQDRAGRCCPPLCPHPPPCRRLPSPQLEVLRGWAEVLGMKPELLQHRPLSCLWVTSTRRASPSAEATPGSGCCQVCSAHLMVPQHRSRGSVRPPEQHPVLGNSFQWHQRVPRSLGPARAILPLPPWGTTDKCHR